MRRVVLLCALVFALVVALAPVPVAAQALPQAPPPPKAWIAVDADSGAVVAAGNEREPRRVASVAKLLTALVVAERLDDADGVTVSARAEGMPARKINLKQGQVWRTDQLLHALLLVSANDAAVALAEQAAGSLEGFQAALAEAAARLGLADTPTLRDPAGLDDEFSVDGGNLMSARDLAIVARAVLASPRLAPILALPEYRFEGGDGLPHRLRNHNRLLRTYPGALGGKTGYTRRAGHSLVAAARRDGRTAVAVVVAAADPYGSASALLDAVFAAPPTTATAAHLPPLPERPGERREAVAAAPGARPPAAPVLRPLDVALLAVGGTPAVVILAARRRRRRPGAAVIDLRHDVDSGGAEDRGEPLISRR